MSTGFVTSGKTDIPVRNLWLLMLYASQLYQRNELLRHRNVEDNPEDLFDLVTEILVTATRRRLQRNIGRQYRQRDAVLTRVRGRIDILATESQNLLAQGKVACHYDELSVDNLRNRVLYTALVSAKRHATNATLHRQACRLADILAQYGVSPKLVTPREVTQLTLGRNERDDIEAVDAAKLLLDMTVPAETIGKTTTRDPERNAEQVRKLYEAAVRGFYHATLEPDWSVSPGETEHRWPLTGATAGLLSVLPIMKTDTVLQNTERRIIIETKFADALNPNRYGQPRLARGHIFQLYAYVQSQHDRDTLAASAEGVLLYPVVRQHLDEAATIQGHRYRFLAVDLAADATTIRQTLLSVAYPAQYALA